MYYIMKITLKERKLPSGKISLLIEYYKGSETSDEGFRQFFYQQSIKSTL